jgi:hypothetical protein
MQHGMHLCLDEFLSWLSFHEHEYVGSPGSYFSSPLALYLSQRDGRVYGVDGDRFGPALLDVCQWRYLPLWARRFTNWSECRSFTPITGGEAFHILATIEQYYGRQNNGMYSSSR